MLNIIIFVVVFSILILLSMYLMKKITPNTQNDSVNNENIQNTRQTVGNNARNNNPDSNRDVRRNNAPASNNNASATEETNNNFRYEDPGQGGQMANNDNAFDPNKKYTKKEIHKMEKKKAKEDQRQYEQEVREMKRLQQEEKEKEIREKEKKKEDERLKEEEEYKKLKEEKKKKEEEEYKKWVGGFTVGDEGEENDESSSESLINNLINYIKLRKVVSLEDLSGEFKLHSNDLVDRLKYLESQGRICGVIDDRGKYIYLTEKEFTLIEKLFSNKGRISKSDLIKECNKLIRFTPTEEDKLKILDEQNKNLEKFEKELQPQEK